MRHLMPAALVLCALAGCAPRTAAPEIEALSARTEALEARVAELEGLLDRVKMAVDLPAEPEREADAFALATRAREALDDLRMADARDLLDTLIREYGDTTMARSAMDMASTLEIIGEDATLVGDDWVQGEHTLDADRTTLLVFFEAWCPHCKREVPQIQDTWSSMKDDGLDVVGVTSFSRDTTEQDMNAFLEAGDVTFPVLRDDGALWAAYRAQGVPHAVILQGGRIIWVGHPAMLERDDIQTLLERHGT